MLTIVLLAASAALGLAWTAVAVSRRAARTALGRIRIASRQALRATKGDATLVTARAQIRALVTRARQLDVQRRASARRLARIDRGALARRADACARSNVPIAATALASFAAESAAAEQLASDHGAAVLELERIESALRTVAMRVAGAGRPLVHVSVRSLASLEHAERTRVALGPGAHALADPVDALAGELDLREQAIAEADAS